MFSELTIIIGILIAALIGYYLTSHSFTYLEAMTDPENKKNGDGGSGSIVDIVAIAKKQTETTKTAISDLNIKEQRASYNTMNDQLEQWVSAKMVNAAKTISYKVNSNADTDEIVKLMTDLNSMKAFKATLDDCAKFIDAH
jgi:hypothetical protein